MKETEDLNAITIDLEEIEKMPPNSVTDAETIRQLALQANLTGDTSLLDRIDEKFAFAGLYPEVIKVNVEPRPEYERRFLLKRIPFNVRFRERMEIEQFYGPDGRFRKTILWGMRGTHPEDGEYARKITYVKEIKTNVGHGKNVETPAVPMTKSQFDNLIQKCNRVARKTRLIYVDSFGRDWEIDSFRNVRLVIAEIEAESESDLSSISVPKDFEADVIKEITGEKEYSNYSLSDPMEK